MRPQLFFDRNLVLLVVFPGEEIDFHVLVPQCIGDVLEGSQRHLVKVWRVAMPQLDNVVLLLLSQVVTLFYLGPWQA